MSEKDAARPMPKLSSIVTQLISGAETRLEIASLEASIAKDNAVKIGVNAVVAIIFGLFALVFVSVALLVIFWDEHRVIVACALAAFYLVMFCFFLGRVRRLSSEMPFAFENSRQIMQNDLTALRKTFGQKESETDEASTVSAADGLTRESPNASK